MEQSDGNFVNNQVIGTGVQPVTATVRVMNPLRTILPKPSIDHSAVSMVSVLSLTNSVSNSLSQISPVIKIDDKKLQTGCIPPNQIFTKMRPVATSVVMTLPTTQGLAPAAGVQRQLFANQIPCYFSTQGIDPAFLFQQNPSASGGGKESVKSFLTLNSHNLLPPQLTKVSLVIPLFP